MPNDETTNSETDPTRTDAQTDRDRDATTAGTHPAEADVDVDAEADEPARDQMGVDLSPTEEERNRYSKTPEGTADPDEIRNDEIRRAVKEGRKRIQEGEVDPDATSADTDVATEPDEDTAHELAVDESGPEEPDEFFDDTLGDPKRDIKEAEQRGLHHDRDAAEAAENSAHADTTTETSTSTMTDDDTTHDRNTPAERDSTDTHTTTADAGGGGGGGEPHDSAPPTGQQHGRDAADRTADAGTGGDAGGGGRGTASEPEDVGEIDADPDEVAEAMGGSATAELSVDDELPEGFDLEEQDIEGASEDAGTKHIKVQDVIFKIQDINEDTAQNLMDMMQDPEASAEDRFAAIIDAVVVEPANAGERTRGWKFMHKATLAGACMEHCGLDDVVDFQ